MAKRRKSPRSKDALQLTRRGFAKRAVAGGVVIWAASRLAWPARLPEGATHENLDRTEAAVLVAAFEVIAGRSDPTEIRGALGRMDAFVGGIEGRPRWELRAALHLVQQSPLLFHGYLSRFSGLPFEDRRKCIEGWRTGALWGRPVFGALKELSTLAWYTQPVSWSAIGYTGPLVPPTAQRGWTDADHRYASLPIHTHKSGPGDGSTVKAKAVVIGSGAGGAAAAYALARRGMEVAVVEAGSFHLPRELSQREEEMYPRLFYDAGGRRTANRAIRVLHGHGVGGSTLHNINLCKRVPDALLEEWKLPGWSPHEFKPYLDEIERLLEVRPVDLAMVNTANALIRKGVGALGWKGGILHHNRRGCVGSGFCELGCSFDAKLNAARVLIPDAVAKGATVYADTRALRFDVAGGRVRGLTVRTQAPAWSGGGPKREWRIEADLYICAGGAVETPLLLERSGVPDPHGRLGRGLRLHPGAAVAGLFDQDVRCWQGIPQSWECTEWLSFEPGSSKRTWIVGGSAHPAGAASFLPGYGAAHAELMTHYPRLVPLSAMLHDRTQGRVGGTAGGGVELDYVLDEGDRTELARGLQSCARILFAAGAREVWVPTREVLRLKSVAEVDRMPQRLADGDIDLVAVHPMGSVPMGTDPRTSGCGPDQKFHGLENLWIADASVYPTSLGVPPQISTYSVGLRVGRQV